jgi:hypothetical protein
MPSLVIYAVMFLAVAGVVGGAYHTVKKSGYAEAEAEFKPKLEACTSEVQKANDAALAVKAEGDRRIAQASKGVAKARQEAKGAISEAEGLRGLAKAPTPPSASGSCPAAAAVAEVRKGLAGK